MTQQPPQNDTRDENDVEQPASDESTSADIHASCTQTIERLQQECETYKSGWIRAQADYQNLQKEVEAKRGELVRMSEAQILEEFLPVYTNFKTAFYHAPKEGEEKNWQNWSAGIGFIMKQFSDILKQYDVEEIKTVGEMFNPELHDAVGEEVSDAPPHTILREVETGYTMKGKVLKVAKVIVCKEA